MSQTQITNNDIKGGGVVFTSSADPTISSNTVNGLPIAVGQVWLNTTSGEMFSCTDATTNANVWTNTGDMSNEYMSATGGTISTDGNFKVHIFTSSGTFTPAVGCDPTHGAKVEYLVIAGGGSGAGGNSGGGGAGGYRTSSSYGVTNIGLPVIVGAGGPFTANIETGNYGNDTIFASITSTGGGTVSTSRDGHPGGSGGGSSGTGATVIGGFGNTPSTTPSQGNNGGTNGSFTVSPWPTAGGGGAGSVGGDAAAAKQSGAGGAGSSSDITGSAVLRGGGGGGGSHGDGNGGAGGTGGGGAGANPTQQGGNGTVNFGGGGGGSGSQASTVRPGAGGSGVVIIRYKFQ